MGLTHYHRTEEVDLSCIACIFPQMKFGLIVQKINTGFDGPNARMPAGLIFCCINN